ncbi:fructose-6-phosphate aldolase [Lactiplantibacillus mudanjiangensis]|uniref:Fructose-6-phosphate aldolase [Lactobacillus plantarum JDM1] n=1 Tax=Lactiplantibacillus mudanjiangensis TaxID=1296538 RepID=A0A660EAX1_9LACO|nr:fructose-6-phosphate aldolase [Lactiplantibacillus mudanjiangensis]VDG20128.1 fructose-6-phosphate aldolase [Lactobacillus plantarum JDM1] [Lactiplantibacillus mudanjiangensis]VDG23823.1 fructose-6-phosphate aldolase [Lactobacillus plantarum JDM1] [Lactiplantibacillus mudanjiangensis]VDG30357.1 fructose-6-phosphate aldolase [Lactobacillus plantarum JDM1] [Lactiplantibacillus mudanjiangensis]VDG33521.1 fructose-6-phosphate aldolase [Lactobacillus plantarum JDM1] [Lactiplantibacillus mudanjian
MEFLLDTVHIDDIKKYAGIIPLSGVTSNPSIVKKEGKIDFFNHMRAIRQIIGMDATFHIQVVGQTTEAMITDAHTILENVDDHVFIKIPTNEAGLAAIKQLKQEGVNVTATAIYTKFQGYLAMAAGADYLAPYYNRMVNMNINADEVIGELAAQICREGRSTKILAASFHTVQQVNSAFEMGAQAATMSADIFKTALTAPAIGAAVKDFTTDWESIYGVGTTVNSLK